MSNTIPPPMFRFPPSESTDKEFREKLEAAKNVQERVQIYRSKLWDLLLGGDRTFNGTMVYFFRAAREAGLSHEAMLACLAVELHYANVRLQADLTHYMLHSPAPVVIRQEKKEETE